MARSEALIRAQRKYDKKRERLVVRTRFSETELADLDAKRKEDETRPGLVRRAVRELKK